MNEETFTDGIARLQAWGFRRGYKIRSHYGDDEFYDKDKEIVYSLRTKQKKHQMYSLLHECGHALAYESKGYKDRYPTLSAERFKIAKVNKKKNIYKVELIAEEHDAWLRGFKLARRLGIELDKEDYNNYASRYVMTYIRKV